RFFPDERRMGINYLSSRPYGREAPYTDRYRQIATMDTNWLVRATALRALNRARDAESASLFIRALNDEQMQIRLEAAKALSNMPDEQAVDPLMRVLVNPDEHRDVRIAAADALRHYPRLEVA